MIWKRYSTLVIIVVVTFIYSLIFGSLALYRYYSSVNVVKTAYIFIPTGSNFDDVVKILDKAKVLKDKRLFISGAKSAGYTNIRSGKYRAVKGMRNRYLIRLLASGQQVPVKLTFSGNIRDVEKLSSIISKQIEIDSTTMSNALNSDAVIKEYGFTKENILSLFIPNTYEVYWNMSADDVLKRMNREYNNFWNSKRTSRLDSINLTRSDVITLASIVNEETNKVDEMPKVAGVYVNRVKKNMKLDADPTVKFAVGDFTLKRVLDRHTATDSPYNTYKYAGIPPGPICMPSIAAIDAVLNYEKHDYYYFCAKSDFSGYHAFSKTLSQHNQYAADYHKTLNKNKIYK